MNKLEEITAVVKGWETYLDTNFPVEERAQGYKNGVRACTQAIKAILEAEETDETVCEVCGGPHSYHSDTEEGGGQ